MKLNLTRLFIRNKMMTPIRVLVSIDNDRKGAYKRIAGKGEIGPLSVTREVFGRIENNPSIEPFSF